MAKKLPRLTLVDSQSATGSDIGPEKPTGLVLSSLAQLSANEQKHVSKLVYTAAPKSGLIGVARLDLPWDTRPVVMVSGDNQPSLLRSVGPDVSRNQELATRIKEVFQLLERYPNLSSGLLDWGECEGQIFYRRMMPRTVLADLLNSSSWHLEIETAINLFEQLVDEVNVWHTNGIAHGHLSTGNISLTEVGQVIFLDPFVGAACATANKGQPLLPEHVLAPELLAGEGWSYSADIYSLGQVFRRLLLALRQSYQYSSNRAEIARNLRPLQTVAEMMTELEPRQRPSLAEVRTALWEKSEPDKFAEKHTPQASIGQTSVSRRTIEDSVAEPVASRDLASATTVAKGRVVKSPVANSEFDLEPLPPLVEQGLGDLTLDLDDLANLEEKSAKPTQKSRQTHTSSVHDEIDVTSLDLFGIDSPVTESTLERKPPSNAAWPLVVFLSLLLTGFWYYRTTFISQDLTEYSYSELKQAWDSRIPSQMLSVAEVAVAVGVDNKLVQDLIVSSAKRGEELPSVINVGLIRIAFHDRWEVNLSGEDRRVVLALALVGLLGEKMPTDLGPLDQRHPGVLLAVTESAGEQTNRILQKIPAAILAKLPPPYGPAFLRLSGTDQTLTCSDPKVQLLAKFSMRGIERAQELPLYLQGNSLKNLQALVMVFSHSQRLSKELLDTLINDPTIAIDLPEVSWAKDWSILNWDELDDPDKLFVLAGIVPSVPIRPENIAKLFTHPAPAMRSYAIDQGLASASFKHPGAAVVLNQISRAPTSLSPEQLFRLALLLSDPEKLNEERIQSWLATEPPTSIVAKLLLATQGQSVSLKLDTWLALYLKTKGWTPELADLRAMAHHPDDYTRLYAYAEILKLKDETQALQLLGEALAREQKPQYKAQLEMMIEQLQS